MIEINQSDDKALQSNQTIHQGHTQNFHRWVSYVHTFERSLVQKSQKRSVFAGWDRSQYLANAFSALQLQVWKLLFALNDAPRG